MSSTASRVQSLLEQRRKLAGVAPVQAAVSSQAAAIPGAAAATTLLSGVPKASSVFVSMISILFYLSTFAFVVFLILTFIHFTIRPVLPFVSVSENIPISQDKQVAWSSAPAQSEQAAGLKNPKTCDYTVSFDIFPTSKFLSQKAPRVFLYRSGQIVNLPKNASKEDLLTQFPNTNVIGYIDAEKNDLYIGVVTSKNGQKSIEYAEKIINIPVQKTTRLTLLVMPTFLEIYMNGKLQKTLIFKGQLAESTNDFWSSPTNVREAVQVGNLMYWPRPLKSTEIRDMASLVSDDFFIKTS